MVKEVKIKVGMQIQPIKMDTTMKKCQNEIYHEKLMYKYSYYIK